MSHAHSGESHPAPTANWVDSSDLNADPYESYDRLRAIAPVVQVPSLNRYLVTTSVACRAVEADQETYSAAARGAAATMTRALGALPMLRQDDPNHARQRSPVNSTLRPKHIRESWVAQFERNAKDQLATLLARGPHDADLNRDFAAPLAARNLLEMLGFHEADHTDMTRWSHAFISGIGNLHDDAETWHRCDEARKQVDDQLDALLARLRSHPDESITSALLHGGLNDDEVRANVKLVISGGMNEPQHVVTGAVWALSRHHEQRDAALSNPALWPSVFDETVRWTSPIGMYPREATRDVVLEGVEVPAGAVLGVVVAAANRDPAAFERPADFDITRSRQPHLGFGSGVHLCAGHWAARIAIGEIGIPSLYEALPELRTDDSRPATWRGWVFRGLDALPVTWTGAPRL